MQLLMGIKPCTDPLPKDLTNDYSNSYLAPFSEGAKYKLNPSEALLGGLETRMEAFILTQQHILNPEPYGKKPRTHPSL